jgi:hypothetical protein
MMRRIWAAIAATVSVVSVFAVLALAQPSRPRRPRRPDRAGACRQRALVPVPVASTGSVHATTQTSPAAATPGGSPAGQPVTYVKTASGNFVPVRLGSAPQTHATTRTS